MNKPFSILFFILTFVVSQSFAQKNNINSYKYILVPSQFEFQKSEDAYQVNSLTKFLFNREGFTVYMTNETIPAELANNSCMALKAIVVNNSGMLTTKMQLKLVDCYNNSVYVTDEVTSKEKDYKKAYHEAIRKAFEEIEELNYKYAPITEAKQEMKVAEIEHPERIVKEVVDNIDDIQVKTIVEKEKIEEVKVEVKVIEKKKSITKPIQEEIKEIEIKPIVFSLVGKYEVEKWGVCTISKNEDDFSIVGGDENFEFAVIYPTSKPNFFIIKYVAYKQPKLVELDTKGNLKIDTEGTIKIYKRVN